MSEHPTSNIQQPTANSQARAVLVMTATITPPANTPLLDRSDPALRRKDYQEALRFYLGIPTEQLGAIIFLENSGSDLSDLKTLAHQTGQGKEVEIIGLPANTESPKFGKGYGEFKMLDQGLASSRILQPTDILWKVTGRLKVLNLADLIATAPDHYDLYCDLRSVPLIGERMGGNNWMDLRTFSCTVPTYDRLMRGHYLQMKGISPEQYFFKPVKDQWRQRVKGIVPRFRIQPRFGGFGGHRNADYQGASYRRKDAIRSLGRRLVPALWL